MAGLVSARDLTAYRMALMPRVTETGRLIDDWMALEGVLLSDVMELRTSFV